MQTLMTTNRMFVLLANMLLSNPSICFQATAYDIVYLWHRRYGHLNYNGLRTLNYEKMVKGLPEIQFSAKMCEDCLVGKQKRESFSKKRKWRASHKLQLVHTDICGPITPMSNSHKSALVEKEAGSSICYFRTDRGGEFTSSEFNGFCKSHGIERQLTTAYTTQQNGVAERRNRTVVNLCKAFCLRRRFHSVSGRRH